MIFFCLSINLSILDKMFDGKICFKIYYLWNIYLYNASWKALKTFKPKPVNRHKSILSQIPINNIYSPNINSKCWSDVNTFKTIKKIIKRTNKQKQETHLETDIYVILYRIYKSVYVVETFRSKKKNRYWYRNALVKEIVWMHLT